VTHQSDLVEYGFGFEAAATERVVWATRFYLIGLMGHSILELASRSFYAHLDARTPLYLAAINVLVYLILAIGLSQVLGANGIALANSIAFTSEAIALLYLLNRRFKGIGPGGTALASAAGCRIGQRRSVYFTGMAAAAPTAERTGGAGWRRSGRPAADLAGPGRFCLGSQTGE
jgi:hypothetical protein